MDKLRDILSSNASKSDIVLSTADIGHLMLLAFLVGAMAFLSLYIKGQGCPGVVHLKSPTEKWSFASWLQSESWFSSDSWWQEESGFTSSTTDLPTIPIDDVVGHMNSDLSPSDNPNPPATAEMGMNAKTWNAALSADTISMLSNLNLNMPSDLLERPLSDFPIWTEPTEIDLSSLTREQQELLLNNQFCRIQGVPAPTFEQRLEFENEGFIEFQGCHILPTADASS